MNINTTVLVGRAGSDPDVRYFESGRQVAKFAIAVNRPVKDAPPDWYNLEMWGKSAEVAANYIRKGDLIGVEGSIKCDRWNDRNTGEPQQVWRIAVDRVNLLGSRKDNNHDNQGSYTHEEF